MSKSTRLLLALLPITLAAVLFYWNRSTSTPAVATEPDAATMVQPKYVGKLSFLALGDSYTIGQSVEPADRWPIQLVVRLRKSGIDLSDPLIIAINREETAKTKAAYVDVTLASRQAATQPNLVAEDRLHPSGKQYALWVENAMHAVQSAMKRPEKAALPVRTLASISTVP